MANYYENTRTNYFRVIDKHKFIDIVNNQIMCSESSLDWWSKTIEGESYYAFGVNDSIDGVCECEYCESNKINEEDECEGEYNFEKMCELLQGVVHPDDAIIITASGYEKLRYVGAYSTIITKTEVKHIDIWKEAIKNAKILLNNSEYDSEYSC